MAEKNTPSRSVNIEKVEGQRWRSEPDTVESVSGDGPERPYQSSGGSGISNRPVGEEIENQESLPDRGTSQRADHADRRNGSIEDWSGLSDGTADEEIIGRDRQSRGTAPRRYDVEADEAERPWHDSPSETKI